MVEGSLIPLLLGIAWLAPLASFGVIVLAGRRLGKEGVLAGYVATGAILTAFACSLISFGIWVFGGLGDRSVEGAAHPAAHAATGDADLFRLASATAVDEPAHSESAHEVADHDDAHHGPSKPPFAITGELWTLGQFGALRVAISYYIDSLTVIMFVMVTLIASLIHFYASGYMHDELHDITDHEVTLSDGHHLHRRGRYFRFFQYLSLFCFAMLGLVYAGNIAMVFVFWELVGVCSYFLIGFYIERKSASNAANKAFIVNRVGDFGMIIGLMALWAGLGTFAFGDIDGQPGIFSQVRPAERGYALTVPDGMVRDAAANEIAAGAAPTAEQIEVWRSEGYGYWLLVIAGLGIFCGCVGKSAQFPLHVWLPDAMEGPTPVSALVHSATMVAAGVYLAGRFFPVFAPEVLLVIAYVGTITLFMAATIAVVATDIKRVLAYSTVSQLGYMMLAIGVGGWIAGLFHLITHAFFKSLLFMCSGSVIHATHTNDMTKMGGLLRKMPYTAWTMLAGVLAIFGAAVPFVVGTSGHYSKDAIIAQVMNFATVNRTHGAIFFAAAAGGAAITGFYMFRMWFMTFLGKPRDHHVYDHAHESPKVMYVPLLILSVFAIGVGWSVPFTDLHVPAILEQAQPMGDNSNGRLLTDLVHPPEHLSHGEAIHFWATIIATSTATIGLLFAAAFYWWGALDPNEVRKQFASVYRFLWNKWFFDELYQAIFIRPVFFVSNLVSKFDKRCIDGLIDWLARATLQISHLDDAIDRYFVDGVVNLVAGWTWSVGRSLRAVQTGKLRQYVMLIVIGGFVVGAIVLWTIDLSL